MLPYSRFRPGAGAGRAATSPEKFFGFQMGADRKLANWDKLHEYYQALAKASNGMQARRARQVERRAGRSSRSSSRRRPTSRSSNSYGRSTRGSPIRAGLPRPTSKKLVADGKAVTIQSFALHSSEVAAVADGRRVRLRQPDAHRRRGDAQPRQRDQHRAAVDQSRRHADDRRLVHEVRRHAARSVAACRGSTRSTPATTTTATASRSTCRSRSTSAS